jgi:hypothetical protein
VKVKNCSLLLLQKECENEKKKEKLEHKFEKKEKG